MLKKLIVILGPTASGKSEMAINLAKKFNGEIISADSRQVYKEMDIGTGKITKKEMKSVPHHLLDVVSPRKIFTVTQYKKLARKAINKIFKKGKLPILCGGTEFYVQAVIDGIIIPKVKPDWKLRKKLEKKSAEELFDRLKKLDPKRAKTIDKKNRRRLVRALEIIIKTKKPVPLLKKKPLPYPVLILGINLSKKDLENRIIKRVQKMLNMGLKKEVESLIKKYGWIPALQTIGYQEWIKESKALFFSPRLYRAQLQKYFENKINKNQIKELIILHSKQFARRQIAWFKKDKRIKWVKSSREAEKLSKKWTSDVHKFK